MFEVASGVCPPCSGAGGLGLMRRVAAVVGVGAAVVAARVRAAPGGCVPVLTEPSQRGKSAALTGAFFSVRGAPCGADPRC